jgi:hypothetical protein
MKTSAMSPIQPNPLPASTEFPIAMGLAFHDWPPVFPDAIWVPSKRSCDDPEFTTPLR